MSLVLDTSYDGIIWFLNIRIVVTADRATGEATFGISTSIRSNRSNRCDLTIGLAFRPVITGSFDSEVDKVVGNVVTFRTLVADLFEMLGSTFGFTRVYQLPLC